MSKKILLIEDNRAIRENTSEILELAGYIVTTAEDGKKGVDAALAEQPDMIICDIMMPMLDGYGVLHLLNKNIATSSIPFIFLTAKAERTDFRKGMEMGADDYITKPFNDIELLNAVEIRLKRAEALKADFTGNVEGVNKFLNEVKINTRLKLNDGERKVQLFKKKQVVYATGNYPHTLFFVSRGKIKTYKINEDGKELITAIYKQGDFLGYIPLLENMAYVDSAEALEDSELMLIPKDDFIALISSDGMVARKFIQLLSHNVVEQETKLINLAYNSLRKRVANGILEVYNKFKTSPDDRPKLELRREDLAQVVGTATESLIRTLSDFKGEKLIEIEDGKIVVADEVRLKNLLN